MKELQSIANDITILYIEDEEEVRDEIASLLKVIFSKVYVANNGQAGVKAYQKFLPDIILSDIQMPVMSGIEMAKQIRNINEDIPIVFITAFNQTEMLMDAIDIGVDKYLIKPLKQNEFQKTFFKIVTNINLKRDRELSEQKLAKLASSDCLTGLPNKTMFQVFLNKQYKVSVRYSHPFSIIKFVINDFHNINDNIGSKDADKLIVEFASLINSTIRDSDFFARLYGVEFAMLLPQNTLNDAKSLIRKLKNIVHNHNFANYTGAKLTMSFAVVEYTKEDKNIVSLLERLDSNFANAKLKFDSIVI